MFLHLSVSHSVHRGSLYNVTSSLAAWSHVPSIGSLSKGSLSQVVSVRGGLCPDGGFLSRGRVSVQGEGLDPEGCLCRGGLFQEEVSSRRGCLSRGGGICPRRGLCPEGLCRGVSVGRLPPPPN